MLCGILLFDPYGVGVRCECMSVWQWAMAFKHHWMLNVGCASALIVITSTMVDERIIWPPSHVLPFLSFFLSCSMPTAWQHKQCKNMAHIWEHMEKSSTKSTNSFVFTVHSNEKVWLLLFLSYCALLINDDYSAFLSVFVSSLLPVYMHHW